MTTIDALIIEARFRQSIDARALQQAAIERDARQALQRTWEGAVDATTR